MPNPAATWPWPEVKRSNPHSGVTRWFQTATDGTSLELFQFDFKENPHLRFEIYDQDEDDAKPFDNRVDYFEQGVGKVTQHLNDLKRGPVLLAWNGLFFAFQKTPDSPAHGWATHIGPVVLDGRAHYNVGTHRWFFGVKYGFAGWPQFRVLHTPTLDGAAAHFDFGADGAQCLVWNGKPLDLQPMPQPTDPPIKQPAPSTKEQSGYIPVIDFLKTSRTSMGWSKDSRFLYVLIVAEPDTETGSIQQLRLGAAQSAGWTLADLQRFWMKLGVWCAVNSDGGAETQRTWLRPDGRYELLTPQISGSAKRTVLKPDLGDAPGDGTLMTFYVSDSR